MNAPPLKDINAAISALMAAEQALDQACEVMRLHDESVVESQKAAHLHLGALLSRFCLLYGARVRLDGDPERAKAWDAAVGKVPA